MKKITKQFLFSALSLSALIFVSCSNKDDASGESSLKVATGVIATVSKNAPLAASQTINEGNDVSYTFTVTLNKPQSVDIHFKVSQIAGTADSDDYTADAEVVIPAYATSATSTIKIINDCVPESAETLTLQIGDVTTSNGTLAPVTLNFTINNTLANALDLTFNYSKAFTLLGVNTSLCAIAYDMDFYLLDSSFADTGIYDAAASGCPEMLTLSAASNLPNGTYYIFYDIWDTGNINGGANTATDGINYYFHDPFTIPITVDYFKCGGMEGTFAQESKYAPTTTKAAGAQTPSGDPLSNFVIQIDIANGIYTLKNSVPQVIASGRNANNIAATIAQARKNNGK
jgi:hypothetical protein